MVKIAKAASNSWGNRDSLRPIQYFMGHQGHAIMIKVKVTVTVTFHIFSCFVNLRELPATWHD